MSTNTVLDFDRYRELVAAARRHFGGGPATALDEAIDNEMVGILRGEHHDVAFFHELRLAHAVAVAGGILADNGMAGRPGADIFDVALAEVLARRES
jgi:hypothetical protein